MDRGREGASLYADILFSVVSGRGKRALELILSSSPYVKD